MATIQAGAFHRRNKVSQAFERIAIDMTAGGIPLTASVYLTSRYAEITIEGSSLRFTVDGTPPTATIGHAMSPNDVIRLDSHEDIVKFRAIAMAGTAYVVATYQDMKLTA